jgi:hypothetical protein
MWHAWEISRIRTKIWWENQNERYYLEDISVDGKIILKWYLKTSVLITKYYSGNQIEKNEMVGACSTCGGKERCIQDFGGET